jgi:hypothetical protein
MDQDRKLHAQLQLKLEMVSRSTAETRSLAAARNKCAPSLISGKDGRQE